MHRPGFVDTMNNTAAIHSTPSQPTAPKSGTSTSATSTSAPTWFRGDDTTQRERIVKTLGKKSFATLGTVSSAGYAHCAGVVYDAVGTTLYVHMMRDSRKARNIATSGQVGVTIPARTLPVGPPNTIHFQANAELLELDDPEIVELAAANKLKKTSGHGAMEESGAVYARIRPRRRIHSYGIGVSTWALIRDPLHVGARSVTL